MQFQDLKDLIAHSDIELAEHFAAYDSQLKRAHAARLDCKVQVAKAELNARTAELVAAQGWRDHYRRELNKLQQARGKYNRRKVRRLARTIAAA